MQFNGLALFVEQQLDVPLMSGALFVFTNHTPNTLKQSSAVLSILPKSYATRSLLSQLIISKYQHGLPLYRQEVILKQLGIQLCRQSMSD
jgi:transposase